jgi:hypothetical protein
VLQIELEAETGSSVLVLISISRFRLIRIMPYQRTEKQRQLLKSGVCTC